MTLELADTALVDREAELILLRRQIHRHPELAFQEHATADLVVKRLGGSGLQLRREAGGTAVVAVLEGSLPGPTVAWRADMDALPIDEPLASPFASAVPGVMHACGHDGHTAIGVVVAEVMATVREQLRGARVFLFQPAEEVFAGARRMLDAGALDDPHVQAVYGLHLTTHLPPGQVAIGAGAMWAAADTFEVVLVGRGAHGAYPHLGASPVGAAAQLVFALEALVARHVEAREVAVLSIGRLWAGDRPNVIPERAVVAGSMRTFQPSVRAVLRERIAAVSHDIAAAHQIRAEVSFSGGCDAVNNAAAPTDHARRSAVAVLGEPQVSVSESSLASDDISVLLAARPGCYFRMGVGPETGPPPPHHSPAFILNERGLLPAARVALRLLLDAPSIPSPNPEPH